jgi:hypothetical protein
LDTVWVVLLFAKIEAKNVSKVENITPSTVMLPVAVAERLASALWLTVIERLPWVVPVTFECEWSLNWLKEPVPTSVRSIETENRAAIEILDGSATCHACGSERSVWRREAVRDIAFSRKEHPRAAIKEGVDLHELAVAVEPGWPVEVNICSAPEMKPNAEANPPLPSEHVIEVEAANSTVACEPLNVVRELSVPATAGRIELTTSNANTTTNSLICM